MTQDVTDSNDSLLEFVKLPPAPLQDGLQRFYEIFDGVDYVLGEWYCPRQELPHLLMLDLSLNKKVKDRQRWVEWRISTLSIAQHIIINDQEEIWSPLNEHFTDFHDRSYGILKAVRNSNDLTLQAWHSIWGDTCCHL